MIKLFWNTHNLNNTVPNYSKEKQQDEHAWGIYHKENSDKWIFEILNKIKFKIINDIKDLETEDTIIIIDSNIEQKSELYTKLELICSKMFLIHLGDEATTYNLSSIYNKFNFIWRTFCSNKYFNNEKVRCLPIGYKSGIFFMNEISERKYKWAFIGTPHKSSRHDLLFQLLDIVPAFLHKTRKFNNNIIDTNEMSKILSSTDFIPCPNGFVHPETYRVYEALECGCIPIVENTYKYYDRLFPNNPFLKVDKWQEAKSLIKALKKEQVKKKQEECKSWWNESKNQFQNFIKQKIYS